MIFQDDYNRKTYRKITFVCNLSTYSTLLKLETDDYKIPQLYYQSIKSREIKDEVYSSN